MAGAGSSLGSFAVETCARASADDKTSNHMSGVFMESKMGQPVKIIRERINTLVQRFHPREQRRARFVAAVHDAFVG